MWNVGCLFDTRIKYIGVLEADQIKREDMKEKLRTEYKKGIRKLLRSKPNGRNMMRAINTWAVSLLRYTAPFVEWRRDELKEMDTMTRKMITMNRALHPRDSVCQLYLPRRGGQGSIEIEDCVDLAILGLEEYIRHSEERLIVAVMIYDT